MANFTEGFEPIDYTKGVYLNVKRDELGTYHYWMTIDGREIELSTNQYEALMNVRHDIRQVERERISKLIETMPWQTYYAVANGGNILDTISMPKVLERDKVLALIKGEQR